jgi:hypothetical protein
VNRGLAVKLQRSWRSSGSREWMLSWYSDIEDLINGLGPVYNSPVDADDS